MTTHKHPRIRWSDSERAALLQAMVVALRTQPAMRWSDAELTRQAQFAALPSERRRRVVGAVVAALKPLIAEARALAKDRPQAPPPTPAPTLPPAPPAPPTLGQLFEELVDALTDRIMLQVLDRLPRELAPERQPAVLESAPTPEPRVQRPGVLIIGLLGAQAAHVIRMFPNLEILHMTAAEAHRREYVRRAHTVLMTKFISHDVQTKYRKVDDLRMCNGGLTELTGILQTITRREV